MTQDPGSGSQMSERMQSLLSRAVEDQLSEQRQLAGALSEVRAQLGQLGTQLDALHAGGGGGAPPHLDEALGAIAGQVREAVRLLGERLDMVGRLVQERGHDLAEQRAVIGELKAAVDRHTGALDGMTGGLAALPAFGERIDSLQAGLGGLADRLQGLEQLTAAVGALQQRSDTLDGDLRELRQAFAGVAARATQLPGREDLDAVGGRVSESIDGLGGRLGRLETSIPPLLERLDALAAAHVETKASLLDIVSRLEAQPAPAAGGEGTSAPDLSGLLAEIGDLRDHLGAPQTTDDLNVIAERVDALHEGLIGIGGISERLRTLEATIGESTPGDATLDADIDALAATVADAVAASEQRITDHVDEAILTLAEALIRRRARPRPTGLGAVIGAGEMESAAVGADDDVSTPADLLDEDEAADEEYDEDDLDEEVADEADDSADDETEDAPGDETGEADDEALPLFRRGAGTPWQTPTPAGAASDADDDVPDAAGGDKPKKRRPWWKPGG